MLLLCKTNYYVSKENEDKIRDSVKASASTSVNISFVSCCEHFSKWWNGPTVNGQKKEMAAVVAC
jgi:hypothetical protein